MGIGLTATERKRLDIVAYSIANAKATQAEIAAAKGCSCGAVNLAIKWGERRGLFTIDASEKLNAYIAEVRKHKAWIEAEIRYYSKRRYKSLERDKSEGSNDDKQNKKTTKKTKFYPGLIAQLSKELREVRYQLLELEGIMQKTINIKVLHEGAIKHDVTLHPAIESAFDKIMGPQLVPQEEMGSDANAG